MADPRPDSEETVRLLDRAATGDQAAIGDLLARYRESMQSFADLHLDPAVRTRLDPSDVAQEALAEMARRLDDYLIRRPMPFHLWVRKTTYERLLNARREHRAACRDVAREVAGPDRSSLVLAQSLLDPRASPGSVAEAREISSRVATAVAGLPDPDREVLLLRHAERLPYEEIGALLDIDPATARKRYGRALIRLQQVLTDAGLLRDVP